MMNGREGQPSSPGCTCCPGDTMNAGSRASVPFAQARAELRYFCAKIEPHSKRKDLLVKTIAAFTKTSIGDCLTREPQSGISEPGLHKSQELVHPVLPAPPSARGLSV